MKTESARRKTTRFVPSGRDGSLIVEWLIAAKARQCYTMPVGFERRRLTMRLRGGWLAADHQRLAKCRQFYQIVLRNRLQRFAGFAPGCQSADDHERVESFFPQQVRHTGAGGLACSSTVKINVFVFGKVLDLFIKIVGFDADGAFDPGRPSVVVAV